MNCVCADSCDGAPGCFVSTDQAQALPQAWVQCWVETRPNTLELADFPAVSLQWRGVCGIVPDAHESGAASSPDVFVQLALAHHLC